MTRQPKTLTQGPRYTHAEHPATLAADHQTSWRDEHGIPTPWPDDSLDPHTG